MKTLTKEQAIIITGYTGITMCNFRHYQEDASKRIGRSLFTHEFANPKMIELLKELYEDDFIAICYIE
jgi:hypothetical protein